MYISALKNEMSCVFNAINYVCGASAVQNAWLRYYTKHIILSFEHVITLSPSFHHSFFSRLKTLTLLFPKLKSRNSYSRNTLPSSLQFFQHNYIYGSLVSSGRREDEAIPNCCCEEQYVLRTVIKMGTNRYKKNWDVETG